ncbi:MAG: metallophosphoesterase [Deltaproteobacteria bacterium]|nr:metallophosphoesterase [Deltaproteobacteria bacterium]
MKYYFFGDIHGNLPALERVLAHARQVGADRVICLGDLVGWLPWGDRILERVRGLGLAAVAGNHDLMVAGAFPDLPQMSDRRQASAFNAGLLTRVPGAREYLLGLPLTLEGPGFLAVHHSPFHLPPPGLAPDIGCFGYLDEAALAASLPAWRDFPVGLILSGHDHQAGVFELADQADAPQVHRPAGLAPLELPLAEGRRYWVKAGSVGGPYRDGVAAAGSVLLDTEGPRLTLFRLPYPLAGLRRELAGAPYLAALPTLQDYLALLDRQMATLEGADF